ncbi:MAG: kelch repeat-containing protein, partial [Planctomycetota bacterium]|nr:kelch repeat-containing protein [Planctomycetota bacterium]
MNRALIALSSLALMTLTACGSSGDSGRSFARNTPAAQMSFQNVNAMQDARAFHTATLLNDGRVLVVGGKTQNDVTPSAEIFDPSTGDWTAVGSLSTPRMNHAATLLPSGDVLIIGGQSDQNSQNALSSTEVF